MKAVDKNLAVAKIRAFQAELPLPAAHRAQEAWPGLLDRLRAAADAIGRKEVAYDLDAQRTRVDNALLDRDRHRIPVEWLLYFLAKHRETGLELLRFLADYAGCELVEREPLTPEQQLERLLTEILPDECGPEQRARILRRLGR